MGGYAFCLAGGGMTVASLALLAPHTVLQRRAALRSRRSSARRGCAAQQQGGRVNLRRKTGHGVIWRC